MASTEKDGEHVFVYGTLRRGFTNAGRDILNLHAAFVDEARMQGQLFDVGFFPAMRPGGPGTVLGEVYRLNDPELALKRLDRYEGVEGPGPAPYVREKLPAQLEHGGQVQAWTYLWTEPVRDLDPVPDGDYLAYVRA